MSEKNIHTALATRLLAIQTEGSPPIAWENAVYTPTVGTLFLKEAFIPNLKNTVGMGGSDSDDYQGIYQVTVFAEAGGRRFDAQEQARLVAAHFPKCAVYTSGGISVKITTTKIEQGLIDGGWYGVPVTILWRVVG